MGAFGRSTFWVTSVFMTLSAFSVRAVAADPVAATDPSEAAKTDQTIQMVDGWILGANNLIIRLDQDGKWQPIQPMPGLKHLQVLPGTQKVVAGTATGILVYEGTKWVTAYSGHWDRVEYSMNYRTMTVGRGQAVCVIQLQPDVRQLGSYPSVWGYTDLWSEGSGGWLASGTGELALAPCSTSPKPTWGQAGTIRGQMGETMDTDQRSQTIVPRPGAVPFAVWVSMGGLRLPAKFVACDDSKPGQYVTVETTGRTWLLRIDTLDAANAWTPVAGERTGELVIPIAPAQILAELDAPVERVVPSPAPYLTYVSGDRVMALNLETREGTCVLSSVPETPWVVQNVQPQSLLTVMPASAFNSYALHGTYRIASVQDEAQPKPLSGDIGSPVVGFGPLRWPPRDPKYDPATVTGLGTSGKLERLPMLPREGEPPVAIVSTDSKAYLVMRNGTLEESKGLFGPRQVFQMSADHKVFTVTPFVMGPQGWELRGPCRTFTADQCLTSGPSGALSADGKRLWTNDRYGVHSYDTGTGDLRLSLVWPPGGQYHAPLWATDIGRNHIGLRWGPEFCSGDTTAAGPWLMADEEKQCWTALSAEFGPGVEPDYVRLRWFLSPTRALVAFTQSLECPPRVFTVPPEKAAARLCEAGTPLFMSITVPSTATLDAAMDTGATISVPYPMEWQAAVGSFSVRETHGVEWSSKGTHCIWRTGYQLVVSDRVGGDFVLDEAGHVTVLPASAYKHAHFTADGEHLLAVVPETLVNADGSTLRQVLAEIEMATMEIVWHSQPFFGCTNMVPHPPFDLEAFHNPRAAGLN